MSRIPGTQYDDAYQPYRPIGSTGNGMLDNGIALGRMLMPGAFDGMGSIGVGPNAAQVFKKQQEDAAFQQAMRDSSALQRQQTAQMLATINPMQYLQGQTGQPFTFEQQQGYMAFTEAAGNMLNPMLAQSASGRLAMDMMVGGNAISNTMTAGFLNRKRGYDPFLLTPGLANETNSSIQQAMHTSMFGSMDGSQGPTVNMSGYHAADVVPIMSYMASRGQMNNTMLERRLLSDNTFKEAVNNGTLTAADLEKLGVSGLDTMAAGNLDTPESKQALTKSIGNRQAKQVADTAEAMAAMKELIGDDMLIRNASELLEQMDNFTREYSQQMSGKNIADMLRQTNYSLEEMGYSFEDKIRFQGYMAQRGAQMGIASPLSGQIATDVAASARGLENTGFFDAKVFGRMGKDEMLKQQADDRLNYANSVEARTIAAIGIQAETIGPDGFTDDARGQEARRLAQALAERGTTDNESFNNMNPAQKRAFIAAGMKDRNASLDMAEYSQSAFLTQRYLNENEGALDGMEKSKREADAQVYGRLAGKAGLRSLTANLDPDSLDQGSVSGLLGDLGEDMLRYADTMTQEQLADQGGRSKLMATRLRQQLQEQAKTNPEAAKILASLGSSDSEIEQALIPTARRGFNEIEMRLGPRGGDIGNMFGRVGSGAEEGARLQEASNEARSKVDSLLVNTVTDTPEELGRRAMEYVKSVGDENKEFKFGDLLSSVTRGRGNKEQNEKLTNAYNSLVAMQQEADADVQRAGETDESYQQRRQEKIGAINKEAKALAELLDKAAEEAGPEPVDGDTTGGGGAGGAGGLSGYSFNISELILNMPNDSNLRYSGPDASLTSLPSSGGNA